MTIDLNNAGLQGERQPAAHRELDQRPRIISALEALDADCDRVTWFRVLAAIQDELGEDGREIARTWSMRWDKYEEARFNETWRSCTSGRGITIATLFSLAREYGWSDTVPAREMSPEEVEVRRRSKEEAAKKNAEHAEHVHARARERSAAIKAAAQPARPDHPYLVRKGVSPAPTMLEIDAAELQRILGYVPQANGEPLTGRVLIIPLERFGETGSCSVEMIDESGRKSALAGPGTKTGAHGRLDGFQGVPEVVVIGEGAATTLTALEALQGHNAAAFMTSSDSNMPGVAQAIRAQYPAAHITILADLIKTTGEPNQRAVEASRAVNGFLAVPDFGPDRKYDDKDFNDLARVRGPMAVREGIEAARAADVGVSDWDREGGQVAGKGSGISCTSVVTTCAADIEMEAISWLWPFWLACGKLHMLAGEAGTGKTTIAIWLAAIVSRGGRWPDGSLAEAGNVLIWSGEDDPKDTLVPRLAAAGADLSRVHIISGVLAGQDVRSFDPAKDMEGLLDAAKRIGSVKMLILDPIVNAVSGDSHKNTEVRRGLQPVVDFGTRTGCAILGITHFSKGSVGRSPLERLVGSLAFGALARVVMVAATRETKDEQQAARVFMRAKSNIGPDDGGYGYDLEQTPIPMNPEISASRVVWGQAIDGKARDVLNQAEAAKDSESTAIAEAKAFLREALSDGRRSAAELKVEAAEAGVAWRTVERAKDGIAVVEKSSKAEGKKWFWRLDDKDRQVTPPPSFYGGVGEVGEVRNKDRQDRQQFGFGNHGGVTAGQSEHEESRPTWLEEIGYVRT